jgi:hypothetical protein
MDTPSGVKDSIPAWIKFSVQAPGEIPYNGIYYDPPEEVALNFTVHSFISFSSLAFIFYIALPSPKVYLLLYYLPIFLLICG